MTSTDQWNSFYVRDLADDTEVHVMETRTTGRRQHVSCTAFETREGAERHAARARGHNRPAWVHGGYTAGEVRDLDEGSR